MLENKNNSEFMQIRLPKHIHLSSASIMYYYAAFHGLAYYAIILICQNFFNFEQGAFRLITNCAFFFISLLLFYTSNKEGIIFKKPPVGVLVLAAYFLWSGLCLLWGNSEGYTVRGYSLTFAYFALWVNYLLEFLIVYLLCKDSDINKTAISYLKGLRLGGLILGSAFFVNWILEGASGRLIAYEVGKTTILHHNLAATKIAISLLASLYLFFNIDKNKASIRTPSLFGILFLMFIMMLTLGKAVNIACLLAIVFYVFRVKTSLSLRFGILALLTFSYFLAVPYVSEMLQTYLSQKNYMSLTGRVDVWMDTWEMIKQKPWFGYGIGTPLPEVDWNDIGHSGTAHNEYLNALYQMGIPGLLILCLMYLFFFKEALTALKKPRLFQQALLGMCLFILMFIISFVVASPVGFYVPLELQMLMIFWMSEKWNRAETALITNPNKNASPLTTRWSKFNEGCAPS